MFQSRITKPEKGNKYYIRKADGGYSDAIKGSPTDAECNVLSNCVGYAYGRFNEIGQYGYCKYLAPVNAENFIEFAGGLEIGTKPKLGACMVWQKGATLQSADGAGHVAIVEQVIDDNTVLTSESAWNGQAFYTTTRKRGNDGRWGMSSQFTFRGFIYNPAVEEMPAPKKDDVLYRVRKTANDSASQKGAYSSFSNAKKCADENKGYSVFDSHDEVVYPTQSTATQGISQEEYEKLKKDRDQIRKQYDAFYSGYLKLLSQREALRTQLQKCQIDAEKLVKENQDVLDYTEKF